jgi:hypothetical protein
VRSFKLVVRFRSSSYSMRGTAALAERW